MRRTPLKRATPMKRSGRLPVKGRPRHKVSGQPDEAYREYVRSLPCCVADWYWTYLANGGREPNDCAGRVEFAHVRSRGAGGTDREAVPLCTRHHRQQHAVGIRTFANRYGLDLPALARDLWARYQKEGER